MTARAHGWLLALGLAALVPGPLLAQQAGVAAEAGIVAALDPGAPDGAELTARIDRPFDRYALPVGPYGRDAPDARRLEGRVIRSAFRLAEPEATTAAVMAGYRERLARLGYQTLFACETEGCGGFDFRFAVELMPPPAMLLDVADFAQLSARRAGEGDATGRGETYVSVLASRLLGAVYIQTVAVAPGEARGELAPVPPAEAAAPLPPGAGAGLLERLLEFGHVQLRGVDFEPGSAAVTAGSAASLDRVARALAARPELSVLVVGHSDNQGPLADNVTLSRRRAEAVRAALIERGIDGARLEAQGAGFLAPVASNASEEGRALNRRVELVLR